MSAFLTGGVVLLCLSGAASIGMLLRAYLPDHHVSADSKDAIKLATAVVGTLSALALGLLIASAKTNFNDAETELRTSVARLLLLDRVMAHYGPETQQARGLLRKLVEERLYQAWGNANEATDDTAAEDLGIEPVQDTLRALSPQTDAQRSIQARALQVSGQIAEAHWLLIEARGEGLPWAFLAILVFWLGLIFFTFGLWAPVNVTVICTLLVCALSVASAVFLIVDMSHPYLGFIHVSDAPLRDALERMGRR
ncbi:DUF4239 domain-containing protein [Mesorhizobium sp. AR10]|uniref:bestrophin-like domain n=1 Tax=Mesorhizobium sp. AR10 TaxID=2865839 RepID=UPI0021609F6B|nr:DUF4239 domain-containing protein [Mesorhizobium sp. AR10]UVK37880.1 DUF4239 domain-containing protein [Mesorhizobium sp. AR10]